MSNNDEKGFLNNVFRDFEAMPDASTKEEVMKNLPEKKRKKRLFFFLLTGFVVAASLFSYRWYNSAPSQKQEIAQLTPINKDNHQPKTSDITQHSDDQEQSNDSDAGTELKQQQNIEQNRIEDQNSTEKKSKNKPQVTTPDKNNSEQPTGSSSKSKTPPVSKTHLRNKETTHFEKVTETTPEKKNQELAYMRMIPGKKVDSISMIYHSEIIELPLEKDPYKNTGKWAWGLSLAKMWCVDCETTIQFTNQLMSDNTNIENEYSSPALSPSGGENNKFKLNSQTTFSFSLVRLLPANFYLRSGLELSKLKMSYTDQSYSYFSGGIPLSLGYAINLAPRWKLQLETGISNHWVGAHKGQNYTWLNNGFFMNTAHFQTGVSYMINEKMSLDFSPQVGYLIYSGNPYIQQASQRKIWIGCRLGFLVRF